MHADFYKPVEDFMFVDPGTSTGICHIQNGEPKVRSIIMWKADKGTRLLNHAQWMKQVFSEAAPKIVVVEQYAFSASGDQVHSMVEIGMCVRLPAWGLGIPLVEMVSSLWKSVTFRAKKAKKDDQADYIYKAERLTGVRASDIDQADALLMAYAAALILGDLTRKTDGMTFFREAIKDASK